MTTTPTAPEVCPGCDGPKSKRAELCRTCRRRASKIGVSVVTHVHEAAVRLAFVPRTPTQSKVYHGKCNALSVLTRVTVIEAKANALAIAGEMFGRPFTSSTQLGEIEMELLLERLDVEIASASAAP